MLGLVDGDILVYRAAYATEYPKYSVVLGDDEVREFQYKKEAVEFMKDHPSSTLEVEQILEPVENAIHVVYKMLQGVARYIGSDNLQVILSGPNNFRKEVAFTKPYKGNRKEKPTHYEALRNYLIDAFNTVVTDGEEADDYIGYMQMEYPEGYSCIVTIDKDLDMIPGLHYNFVTEQEYYVTDDQADWAFLRQLLTGDATDNIPGIPGTGEAKAAKQLDGLTPAQALDFILSEYRRAYPENGDAVFNEHAELLWIRREPDQRWTDYWEKIWQPLS